MYTREKPEYQIFFPFHLLATLILVVKERVLSYQEDLLKIGISQLLKNNKFSYNVLIL